MHNQTDYHYHKTILSAFFIDPNPIQNLLFQFQQLKQAAFQFQLKSQFDKIILTLLFDPELFNFKIMTDAILFQFIIKKGFPISPLRIYLRSDLFQPYISDIRDLLTQIINGQWHHGISLREVAQKIPTFLKYLNAEMYKPLVLQKIGAFYLGESFTLQELRSFKSLELFQCFKLQEDQILMNYICLSETHLLIFFPDKQPQFSSSKLSIPKANKVYLNFYGQINSISELKISKQESSELTFTLRSYKQKKMNLQPIYLKYTYRIVNSKAFIGKILRTVTKFQNVNIDYHTSSKGELTKITDAIKKAQQNLAHYLNKQNINTLNTRYQDAVQYLSGINSPYYLIFVNKIARLFNRQDVKLVSELKL